MNYLRAPLKTQEFTQRTQRNKNAENAKIVKSILSGLCFPIAIGT